MVWEIWAAACIIAVALIFFLIFATRTSYRQPTIHETSGVGYKNERDRVALEEAGIQIEDEGDEEDDEGEEEIDERELNITSSAQASVASSISSSFSTIFFIALMIGGLFLFVNISGLLKSDGGGNYTSEDYKSVVVDGVGTAGEVIVEWLDLIVLLIVLSFIIGMFVKIGGMFGGGPFEDEPTRRRSSPKNKNKAIKHYEGMRTDMTRASAKRDREKAERLRREGER